MLSLAALLPDWWPAQALLALLLAAALPLALMPLLPWRRGGRRLLGGGTHVLITGGSKGLGLALARQCTERGCAVTVVARNQADLAEALRQLEAAAAVAASKAKKGQAAQKPAKVQALSADTADPDKVGVLRTAFMACHVAAALWQQACPAACCWLVLTTAHLPPCTPDVRGATAEGGVRRGGAPRRTH